VTPVGGRHVALIVDDDELVVRELRDFLDVLGHECIHAETKEEAMVLVAKGSFCYVLLDLQIKNKPDSIRARVEAGQALLTEIRELYPTKRPKRGYCLPVLVMSGHAKETRYLTKAFHDGADDFLTKPFTENQPPLDEKIRECLRASGRDKHERCAEMMRQATASAANMPPGSHDQEHALVVDLRTPRVIYRGREIPTRPPGNLQRQTLLALAVLAEKRGEAVSMAEIAEGMSLLGGSRERFVAPEQKDLRYKILRPFRSALSSIADDDEIDKLVVPVRGVGLRLNFDGTITVLHKAH